MTTQAHLKKLTQLRQDDATALFAAKRYSGAYYISGLAVECGIKVIIAHQFKGNRIPDKTLVVQTYSHDLKKLIALAGLVNARDNELNVNFAFFDYWNVVKDWNINCRYNPIVSKIKARDMLQAINDATDGVISWLRRRW